MKTPTIEAPRLSVSAKEGAHALGVSEPTMYRAIAAGLIRAVWMGRMIRIPNAEMERVAAEGMPSIPRYKRKTTGPTKRGRPRKAVPPSAKGGKQTVRETARP